MLNSSPRSSVNFLLVFLLLAAVGCANGLPAESDARQLLEEQISEQSDGRIQLVSFQKTNGQKAEMAGVELYSLEWEATIEFEECLWQPGSFKTSEHKNLDLDDDFSWEGWNRTISGWKEVKGGTRRDITGTYRFEMTENGWQASGGDLDM